MMPYDARVIALLCRDDGKTSAFESYLVTGQASQPGPSLLVIPVHQCLPL